MIDAPHVDDPAFHLSPTLVRRWHEQADKGEAWACWEWQGIQHTGGYGKLYYGSLNDDSPKRSYDWWAHRIAHELFIGPIPPDLEVDHICRNRGCVNPYHLRAVTPAENQRNSDETNAVKTHCPQGHPYDDDNTYIHTDEAGQERRRCRACNRRRQREWRARQRAS